MDVASSEFHTSDGMYDLDFKVISRVRSRRRILLRDRQKRLVGRAVLLACPAEAARFHSSAVYDSRMRLKGGKGGGRGDAVRYGEFQEARACFAVGWRGVSSK